MSGLFDDALAMLHRYSINYVEPVLAMPPVLQETMLGTYLLMRGIDEVEDHPDLDNTGKVALLEGISQAIQARITGNGIRALFAAHGDTIDEVSLRLADWAALLPDEIAPRVLDAFATMAERMADWVRWDFRIDTKDDLDRYTYSVAGALALMLGDIWSWFDGTHTNRTWLLGYGRGVQAANIMQDKGTDLQRGVSFWPHGWTLADMRTYAQRELTLADRQIAMFPEGSPARRWCEKPLAIAWNTVTEATQPTGVGDRG